MVENEKECSLQRRAKLFDQIADTLGTSSGKIIEMMAPYIQDPGEDGKNVAGALRMARKRGHLPDKPKYSYENFYLALEKGMDKYLSLHFPKGGKKAAEQNAVRKAWEEKQGVVLLIVMAYHLPSDELLPNIKAALEEFRPGVESLGFKARFMGLDPWTAARVERNFVGYKSVTERDYLFVVSLLTMSETQRTALHKRLSAMPCPTAEDMLKQLAPEELVCWQAIRDKVDNDGEPLTTGESWTSFQKKAAVLPVHRELVLFLFLDVTLPGSDKLRLFTPEDMDLFLMFKYCLTEAGREAVLDQLKAGT